MSDIAVQVEHIAKLYQLGENKARYITLRESLVQAAQAPFRLLAKKSPGQLTSRNTLWALDDISFEVKKGEAVGIIGRNGAGKSTLLKILSRITRPTKGHARVFGRLGSLLEVGTGFHPELTGRENIYLNGAILGIKRVDINRQFDAIVEFAETEKFLDTPVKYYSSGMYMRLAFAVAAHLEPEILVIDEVLAVGDAQFQKKCLGKMSEVAHAGRTVLFVSHNMGAILQLCTRAILLDKGHKILDSDPSTIVSAYMRGIQSGEGTAEFAEDPEKSVQILSMSVISAEEDMISSAPHTAPISILLKYRIRKWNIGSYVCLDVFNEQDTRLLWSCDVQSVDEMTKDRNPGVYTARITIPGGILAPGRYTFTGAIFAPGRALPFDAKERAISVEITDGGSLLSNFGVKPHSATMIPLQWDVKQK